MFAHVCVRITLVRARNFIAQLQDIVSRELWDQLCGSYSSFLIIQFRSITLTPTSCGIINIYILFIFDDYVSLRNVNYIIYRVPHVHLLYWARLANYLRIICLRHISRWARYAEGIVSPSWTWDCYKVYTKESSKSFKGRQHNIFFCNSE